MLHINKKMNEKDENNGVSYFYNLVKFKIID